MTDFDLRGPSDKQDAKQWRGHLSIRAYILTFALLATLIPTLTIGFISYQYTRVSLEEGIEQEFQSATSHISREVELWLRERLFDAGVFANSYVVTENLQEYSHLGSKTDMSLEAKKFMTMYLASIHDKYQDYEELLITNIKGTLVASNVEQPTITRLPDYWADTRITKERMLGKVELAMSQGIPTMLVGAWIVDSAEKTLGIFAISVSLRGIIRILQAHPLAQAGRIHLIDNEGQCLISSDAVTPATSSFKLDRATLGRLRENQGKPIIYQSIWQTSVIGTLFQIPQTGWAILAEKTTALAFLKLDQQKKAALCIVLMVLIVIATLGSLLSLTIVRPIHRLIVGARKVAKGDLTVSLTPKGPQETVYLIRKFNEMVRQLLANHAQLEYLSITDSLTSLYNRKHLMQSFHSMVNSAENEHKDLSIMMVDIDSFKVFNDTHGHQAGDEIIIQVVGLIRASLKDIDFPARYGGDEFLILLPETSPDDCLKLAETIRALIEHTPFLEKNNEGPLSVTISVGVSGYPRHGTKPRDLIKAADDALYLAKAEGRNRVILAR
ncbi:diguanylate cyclase [bacterium]|nr:diguanylate cyclase [bacterium]